MDNMGIKAKVCQWFIYLPPVNLRICRFEFALQRKSKVRDVFLLGKLCSIADIGNQLREDDGDGRELVVG